MIIVAQFKNAANRLEEWLKHHSYIGFKKFFLYDDSSTDDSVKKIKELSELDITLLPSIQNSDDFNRRIVDSSNDALMKLKLINEEIPIAFIDVDEYLVSVENMIDIIQRDLIQTKYDILYVPSYDVKPTYDLDSNNITLSTKYRWSEQDRQTQLNGLYKNRGKSITTNKRCPKIENIHVLHDQKNGIGLVKGVSTLSKNIRIHHFRIPPQFNKFDQFDDTLINITTKRLNIQYKRPEIGLEPMTGGLQNRYSTN